jgi:predicted dehydrogenase
MSETSTPLQLGVLGCGRVFERYHLPAIARSPAVSLRAACDTGAGRMAWAKSRVVGPILFDSPAGFLACPGLEAVLILTPPENHADAVLQALESGLHVLVEKPMALHVSDARRMVRSARQAQRRLQVGFNRRFREPYRRLRSIVQQLERRRLRAVRFELAFPTTTWKSRTDFLGDESRGGGVLDDVLSHQVDLVCWILGARPEEVRAAVKGPSTGGIEAELRLGSVVAHFNAAHARYAERLEIELDDGSVLEASGSQMRSTVTRFAAWRRCRALLLDRLAVIGHRLLRRPNITLGSFEDQLADFQRAVRGGAFDGTTGDEGLLSVEIVEACKESALQQGAWQALDRSAKPAA